MFKHAFHGGPAVEILSTSGKNPLEKWKTSGTIAKSFDSALKSYIYNLDGQSKLQIPKDEKDFLGLIQPFLVFQIFIPLGKNIHIEVGITDASKTKRRLIFHSGAKDIVANPLHARIPITMFRRNQWVNLSLDIFAFAHHCFKGVNIRSIDFINVTATCKLRRIFTMKNPLYDDQEQDDSELQTLISELMLEEQRENLGFDFVPKSLNFPLGFVYFNQFIFPQRLKHTATPLQDENFNQGNDVLKKSDPKVQLAFGQRVVPKHQVPKKQQKRNGSLVKPQQQDQTVEEEIVSTDQDFYSPLASQDVIGYKPQTKEDQIESTIMQKVTKEDLKEETHYLYLNNSEDENDNSAQKSKPKALKENLWDNIGREGHDKKVSKKKVSPRQLKVSPRNKRDQSPKEDQSNKFYSPLSNNIREEDGQLIRLESEQSENIIQKQIEKVNQLQSLIHDIQYKHTKPDGYEYLKQFSEQQMSPKQQAKQMQKSTKPNKTKLKKFEEEEKKYTNFHIEKWGGASALENDENDIEEAFEINHQNLLNYDQYNEMGKRKSQEFKENPMFIEFELNNDDENEVLNKDLKSPPKVFEGIDTNNSYQILESSRREERRPFSPPFKFIQQNHENAHVDQYPVHQNEDIITDFDRQIQMLKVQRTEILRDSLDVNTPEEINLPSKATAQNEDGEVIEVLFDPVFKCYYDPKTNTYYELKQ